MLYVYTSWTPALTSATVQGLDFNDNLTLGGPASVGYGKANLSPEVLAPLTEVAVSEQARAHMIT